MSSQSVPRSPAASWSHDLLLLGLFFGALNLFMLGRLPLANPDEARYAEIPREMIATGDWVTPRLNDTPYFEKPPLVYWCVGLSRIVFGSGEFAARLTPALFAIGGILLTYAAADGWTGARPDWPQPWCSGRRCSISFSRARCSWTWRWPS